MRKVLHLIIINNNNDKLRLGISKHDKYANKMRYRTIRRNMGTKPQTNNKNVFCVKQTKKQQQNVIQ
jgi:hypothetical protein